MEMDQETNKKIQELQMLEQSFQQILMQKQQFQIELNETKTALKEVEKTKGDIFRVLGQVMVKAESPALKKELKEKQDILSLRIKSIDKQEMGLRQDVERLRNDIVSKMQ